MNLFFLSQVAAECARFHCDKHVVKMILEYAQLMYSAHSVNNVDDESWREGAPFGGYRKTHTQHPTAIWARSCQGNYTLLAEIAKELCMEYTHRYSRQHKTEEHIDWLRGHLPPFPPPPGHDGRLANGQLAKSSARKPVYFSTSPVHPTCTPLPLTMPEECYLPDACLAYQKFYVLHKRPFAKWSKRDVPAWFSEGAAKLPILPAPEKKPVKKQPKKRRSVNDGGDGDDEGGESYPSGKRKKKPPLVKVESTVVARKPKQSSTPLRNSRQRRTTRAGFKVPADAAKSSDTVKNEPPAVRTKRAASASPLPAKRTTRGR